MKYWKLLLLLVVAGVLVLFAFGLGNNPREIPSPLVNRPAPALEAPALDGGEPISLAAHRGKWVLVNFWGSWCVSCVAEHRDLIDMARKVEARDDIVIIGVDFKDTVSAAKRFLKKHGDPGYRHAFDPDQRIAIDWGVYGAPETFVVSPDGVIRYKQAGPIYPGWFEEVVLPLVETKEGRG